MDTEPFDPEAEFDDTKPRTRYGVGLCGLLFAIFGLTIAIAGPSIVESLTPPPPPEEKQKLSDTLAEAGEKFVDRMLKKVRRKVPAKAEAPPPIPTQRPWLLYLSITSTSLGLIGSLSGMIAWIRREDPRMAGCAIATGALAVAWVYIVAALVIALVISFLLVLIGPIGGST